MRYTSNVWWNGYPSKIKMAAINVELCTEFPETCCCTDQTMVISLWNKSRILYKNKPLERWPCQLLVLTSKMAESHLTTSSWILFIGWILLIGWDHYSHWVFASNCSFTCAECCAGEREFGACALCCTASSFAAATDKVENFVRSW